MESEDFGLEKEKKEDNNSFSCFGEYGLHSFCQSCKNARACKYFSEELKDSSCRRYKSKYRGRGKWRRRDYY